MSETYDPSTWGHVARNASCPCGSGLRFKHCHGRQAIEDDAVRQGRTRTVESDLGQAAQAFRAGDFPSAREYCRKVLAADPQHLEAMNLAGIVAAQLGDPTDAMNLFRRAIALDGGFLRARSNLGIVLRDQGRLEDAVEVYRETLSIDPSYPEAHYNLGVAYQALGDLAAAQAAYRRAAELRPDFAMAYRSLAFIKKFDAEDPDFETMAGLLDGGTLDDAGKIEISFALGKAHEDIGDYDGAFAHFERGNALKRKSLNYDIADDEAMADRIVDTFSHQLLSRFAGAGTISKLPVFIVGMPRSGTSLIEQILASHSQVHGAGEINTMFELANSIAGFQKNSGAFPEAVTSAEPADLRRLGRTYLEQVRDLASEARRVTDKMTSNFRYLGLITAMLPQAAIIHCRRDPVDTCLGCFKQLFTFHHEFAYDLAELGRYFRSYGRLMRHWHEVMPTSILDVSYEELVADPKPQIERILGHCELSWEDACLAFHESDRPVRTASAAQVREPIFADGVARWKSYEGRLGPLIEALGDEVELS